MTVQEAKKAIINSIVKITEPDVDVTEETEVVHGLGLPSVEVLMLLGELEDIYDVELSPKVVEHVKTVGELCDVIISQLRGQS
ncbi:MAG TPA: acyl carrier protein [Candidatus Onthomonas avicola]|nr:acyl carrier protein [Candidatus Onthomonas avicola]